ncbi:MAG TPA: hypothetical protein VK922_04595 [Gemmatimonadaceae bacterium]|nr:hypothetical protein [Gemmatimonadaceae bacterium]
MLTRRFHAAAALILVALHAPHLAAQEPARCDDVAGFHRLDFWVGEWDVKVNGALAGTNTIEKILDGCAILEHWRGAGGQEGMSLFYFDRATDTWKQVWVTQTATAPGGVKEKTMIAPLPDGAVRFQGKIALSGGRHYLDRTTLSRLPDGRVRQVIATSIDDGATWRTQFDAIYERRS